MIQIVYNLIDAIQFNCFSISTKMDTIKSIKSIKSSHFLFQIEYFLSLSFLNQFHWLLNFISFLCFIFLLNNCLSTYQFIFLLFSGTNLIPSTNLKSSHFIFLFFLILLSWADIHTLSAFLLRLWQKCKWNALLRRWWLFEHALLLFFVASPENWRILF